MSYLKSVLFQADDWVFYQAAINHSFAEMPEDWKDAFAPNESEEIYCETFDDGFEVRLQLLADETRPFLSVSFSQDGEPLDKDYVLALSVEGEDSLLDTTFVGFLYRDTWHMLSYRLPKDQHMTFPYRKAV